MIVRANLCYLAGGRPLLCTVKAAPNAQGAVYFIGQGKIYLSSNAAHTAHFRAVKTTFLAAALGRKKLRF